MPIIVKSGGGTGGGIGGYQYPTRPVGNIDIRARTNGTIDIKWKDPDDVSFGGYVIGEWRGTIVVCKQGSPPITVNDGEVIVDSRVKNQFKTTPLNTNKGGKGYYYGIFPYTKDYVVDNRDLNVKVCEGVLHDNTWSEIISMINSGANVQDYFDVGDEKEITLNGAFTGGVDKNIIVQVAGFNHDDLSSGSGKASVTFTTKPKQKIQAITKFTSYNEYTNSSGVTTEYMNPEGWNFGNNRMKGGSKILWGKDIGYDTTNSRSMYSCESKDMSGGSIYDKFFLPILNSFPTEIKNGIKEVKKKSFESYNYGKGYVNVESGSVWQNAYKARIVEDTYKLFPFSLTEVFSTNLISKQMPYFSYSGGKQAESATWIGNTSVSAFNESRGLQYALFSDIENVLKNTSNPKYKEYYEKYYTNEYSYQLRDCVYNGGRNISDFYYGTMEGSSSVIAFGLCTIGGNKLDYSGNLLSGFGDYGPGYEPMYRVGSEYKNYTETMFGFCI